MNSRKKYERLRLGGDEPLKVEIKPVFPDGKWTVVHRALTASNEARAIKLVRQPIDEAVFACEEQKFTTEKYCMNALRGAPHLREVVEAKSYRRLPRFLKTGGPTWLVVYKPFTIKTLREVISSDAPVKPTEFRAFLKALLLAFTKLQEEGIVHRDLKPENIFVNESLGDCYVGDFGLATYPSLHPDLLRRQGTDRYCPPEWRTSVGRYSRDVFSLAMVLYELLVPRRQFELFACAGSKCWDAGGSPKLQAARLGRNNASAVLRELKKGLRKSSGRRHRNVPAFVSALLLAGAKDKLWSAERKEPARLRKTQGQQRSIRPWRYEDNRPLSGALWFYLSWKEQARLEKASPSSTRWEYHEPRQGFWTKDTNANPRTICRKANRRPVQV
ncbi:MAG: protein kinase domain-containing protein [Gemmatimonadaceae bacterium]